VLGVPELPCVAGRYGTNSAFCAVLVMLQISIPYSVVKAKKNVASKWWWTNLDVCSQGSLSDCLRLGDTVRRTNSKLLLIIMTIFKVLISALAPVQASAIGPCWRQKSGQSGYVA